MRQNYAIFNERIVKKLSKCNIFVVDTSKKLMYPYKMLPKIWF